MKILQLCLRVPDPPGDGGAIAMKAISQSLIAAGATVKILAFNTKKHFAALHLGDQQFIRSTALETVYLDASVKVIPAFLNLFARSSYNIQRFKSRSFELKLIELLKNNKFDIIQLESLFLASYVEVIRKYATAKIVLRAHNIEYLIWQRMAAATNALLKKKYLELLSERLRTFEISMLNKYDAILPITREDEKTLRHDGCRLPVFVTPFGLDLNSYSPGKKLNDHAFSVFHLGSMDWMPNLEGVDWFLKSIFPLLSAKDKTVKVFLAGKSMPRRIMDLAAENLAVEGLISDAVKYMSDKTIMVVPLLSGGGMRVKIIEGMAMGKTVISTSIGAEGIDYTHLENILIADTPEDFVKWILQCKSDPGFCSKIGQQGVVLAASKYDNRIIGQNLYHFYTHELLGSFNLAP